MATNGNCFMCGKTTAKTAMKNHIMKEHNIGDEGCYLFKAEGAYDKDYWILFSVRQNSKLSAVDEFLREIWCECCGHLSAFRRGGSEVSKSRKISTFSKGDKLHYEYDFGSTTEILVTVMDEVKRPKQKESVVLLARNEPYVANCDECSAPAEYVNIWENKCLCEDCIDEDEEGFMPIVNSPRSGECGYDGELDRWTFYPHEPFPQMCLAENRARYARVEDEGDDEVEETPEERWGKIDTHFQQKLIESVFCRKCGVTTIKDYTLENNQMDVLLKGKCAKCNGKVARLVECE